MPGSIGREHEELRCYGVAGALEVAVAVAAVSLPVAFVRRDEWRENSGLAIWPLGPLH